MAKSTTFQAQLATSSPNGNPSESHQARPSNRFTKNFNNPKNDHSSGSVNQDLADQQNDILDSLMKNHLKKGEEAAKIFGANIRKLLSEAETTGESLFTNASKIWENGVGGVLKSLSSSLDSEEYNETSQENQQHLSSRFAALEEVGHEMESPPDAGLMEGLPLVYDGRAKRVKHFRRKEVNTFKREEAEVIEYQKTSNDAKLLTEAVKNVFKK